MMKNSSALTRDHVAFVTGAGQGIGKAIAIRLHSDGFRVALADISEASVAELAEELGGRRNDAIALHVDVANRDSVFAALDEAVNVMGDLHVVVNNAGLSQRTPLEKVTAEEFDRITATNFGGVLWGIQAAAAAFDRLKHGGKILNASSQAGHIGNAGAAVYSGTKFAVRGLTQAAARELAPRGITVNAWSPGVVNTAMLKAATQNNPDEVQQLLQGISLQKVSEPEEVAAVVSFLAGADSNYINGQSILVDGGMAFS